MISFDVIPTVFIKIGIKIQFGVRKNYSFKIKAEQGSSLIFVFM